MPAAHTQQYDGGAVVQFLQQQQQLHQQQTSGDRPQQQQQQWQQQQPESSVLSSAQQQQKEQQQSSMLPSSQHQEQGQQQQPKQRRRIGSGWGGAVTAWLEDVAPNITATAKQQLGVAFANQFADVIVVDTEDRAASVTKEMVTWLSTTLPQCATCHVEEVRVCGEA